MSTVFTKLGSQLTAEKLTDLAIIPVIFIVQTFVSYFCSFVVAKCCRFKKRQSNFVAAMAVCDHPYLAEPNPGNCTNDGRLGRSLAIRTPSPSPSSYRSRKPSKASIGIRSLMTTMTKSPRAESYTCLSSSNWDNLCAGVGDITSS
jgi:hypothetical protein